MESEYIKNPEKTLLHSSTSFICLNCNSQLNIASFNTFEKTCLHESCVEQFAFEDKTNLQQLKTYLQLFTNKIHNLLILLPNKIKNPEECLKANQFFIKQEQTYSNLMKKSYFNKKEIKKIFDFYITYHQIFNKSLISKGFTLGINDLLRNYKGIQLFNEDLRKLYEIRYSLMIPTSDYILLSEGKKFRVLYNSNRLFVYNLKESKVESALIVNLSYSNKSKIILVEALSLVIYFVGILYLWNYHKHLFIELPCNFASQISKIFVFNDIYLVSCTDTGIKIWNIVEKTFITDINNIAFAKPCPVLNNCERCLYFSDNQDNIYYYNIKNNLSGLFIEHGGKILEAALMNSEKSLIIFCELSIGERIQVWNTQTACLDYSISKNKSGFFYFGKARIFPEANTILFKSFAFDVKNNKFHGYDIVKRNEKIKNYKNFLNLNGESVNLSKKKEINYGNTTYFNLDKNKKIILFFYNFENIRYLEIRTTKNKLISLLKFINILNLTEAYYKKKQIVIRSYNNVNYLNFQKEFSQVSYDKNAFCKVDKNKKYFSFLRDNKINVSKLKKNKLDTIALSSCIPKAINNQILLFANKDSLFQLKKKNFEIKPFPFTLLSEKILYLELIGKNQVFAIGENKSFLFDLNNNLVIGFMSHKKLEGVKKVDLITKKLMLVQGYSEFLVIFIENLSIVMDFTLILDQDYKVSIANYQKYLIIIHKTQTVICDLENKVHHKVFYHSQSAEIYKFYLELSGFLLLIMQAPHMKIEEISETSANLELIYGQYSLLIVNLRNPKSIYMKCFKKKQRIQILNNRYILFNDTHKLLDPINGYEKMQLNIENFAYFAGGPKSQINQDWVSGLIQYTKSIKNQGMMFNFRFRPVGINYIKISNNKKFLYLSGTNYRLLIFNLKEQYVHAVFFTNLIESIKDIIEFPDQKFILLANSRRIMKFDLKTYKSSILINNLHKFSYYTVYKNRFIFARSNYPCENPKMLLYDIYEDKLLIPEKYNKLNHCKIVKIGNFLILMQNKIYGASKNKTIKSNTFIDLNDKNAPFISEFKHLSFYHFFSSGFKGARKEKQIKFYKFYMTANQENLIAVENSCLSIINTENLEIKKKFHLNVSHLIPSSDTTFFAILHSRGCIQCLNLITLELNILYVSLQPIKLLAISPDNQYIISYIEETLEINRHYIPKIKT